MSQHPLERFANNNFLLERARGTLRYLSQRWKQNLLSFTVRVLLFGGLLGLMWTLSHLHPHGDLSLYLIPITLLALPIGFIAPNEHPTERAMNWLFLGSFAGCLIWSGVWYFTYYEWGYLLRWFTVEASLLLCLAWVTLKPRPESWDGPQQSLLKTLWQVGVGVCLASLGFLAYYLISQSAPESGTANILTGATFLFFLSLTIVRVYWLDGIRLRRANRGEFSPPPDYVLLVEWLIPRSYSFVAVLVMLLVSEAMMFSTVYRANAGQLEPPPPPQLEDPRPAPSPNEYMQGQGDWAQPPLSLPWSEEAPTRKPNQAGREGRALQELEQPRHAPEPEESTQQGKLVRTSSSASGDPTLKEERVDREVSLGEWVFFTFKPYVFPKDLAGREVSAPQWFKVLGRALLGLIIAILLTKQLNIWKQLSALYLTLLGAFKRSHHLGDDEELGRQREEMLLGLRAMFNTHATFWRWRLFDAVTAPTLSLTWRVLLDPSSAFFISLERTQRWVGARWDMALLSVALLITACTAPIAFFDELVWTLYPFAVGPVLIASLLISVMRVLIGLKPPKSYQQWLWWSLLVYIISALVAFFLALNIGSRAGFWPEALWYLQLCTIGVFPALYVFGGERYRRVSELGVRREVTSEDSDYAIRLTMLRAFMQTEHREWAAHKITRLIHPVRSGSLQIRLLWSSLMLSLLDTLRIVIDQAYRLTRWATRSVVLAMTLWIGVQLVAWTSSFLIHLFLYHRLLPEQVVSAYLLNLACLLTPSALPLVYAYWVRWRSPDTEPSLKAMTVVSLLGTLSAMSAWLYLYSTSPVWNETTRYSWFTFLFIHPWLPMLAVLRERAYERGVSAERKREAESLFMKTQAWLQRAERASLQNAYELASKANPLELELRIELVESCARLMELTIADIKSGRWYEEEGHALQRIYRQWVGISDREAEEQELIEELGYLLEHLLDTLGSLLYDVSVTDRFGDHELKFGDEEPLPKLPYVEVILTTMIRIAQLPHPNHLGAHKGVSESLDALYHSLEHLIWTLLINTHTHLRPELEVHVEAERAGESPYSVARPQLAPRPQLTLDRELESATQSSLDARATPPARSIEELTPSARELSDIALLGALQDGPQALSCELSSLTTLLVELLCYLNPPLAHARLVLCSSLLTPQDMIRLARDESHSAELLSALALTQSPDHQAQSQLAIWMNQLPTPLANLALQLERHVERWQDLSRTLFGVDQDVEPAMTWTDEWQLPTDVEPTTYEGRTVSSELTARATMLSALQSPERFAKLKERLRLRHQLDEASSVCATDLLACYLASYAYLLSYLKDLSASLPDAHPSGTLIQQLQWDSLEELKVSLLAIKRARFPEALEPTQSLILSLFPLADIRCMERRGASHRDLERALKVWRGLIQGFIEQALPMLPTLVWRQTTSVEAGKVYTLALIGHRPQLIEVQPGQWHLGRGVRMKGADERPLLDFYSSLWVLKCLNALAHSDSLFYMNEAEEHGQVSFEALEGLRELVSRFGRMLRSFAPEEQRQIEEMYNHISRRLALFETLTPSELQNFEGQGEVDYARTFTKVSAYLDGLEGCMHRRFQHLLKLQVLPSDEFMFLTGLETCDEGELHWYDDPFSYSSELTLTQQGASVVTGGGLTSSAEV